MNKIEVYRTSIVINDYTLGDCPTLEKKFRLWDEVYFKEYYKGMKYDTKEKKLHIPSSMNIQWLEQAFGCVAHINYGYDEFEKNSDILMKYIPRDDNQKEAMRFTLGLNEYEQYKYIPQQMLALDTGKGKTFVAIYTLAFTMIKGVIIAPSIGWLEQWRDKIVEYTDIKSSEIYMIQGSATISKILKGRDMSKFKIYLASTSTIKTYGDKHGWDKITQLFKLIKVGYKIYDEAHTSFEAIMDIDYATNTYKTLYLTATPGRSDNKEDEVYHLYMERVPQIDLFDPDKDPHTQYIAFKYNSRLTGKEQNKCINKYGFNKNNYCNIIIHKENFLYMMHIVMDMIRKVTSKGGKVLVYIATNDAIVFIYNWIINNYPEYTGNIGIYTSINEHKKEAKSKLLILSTTKSAGAAEDIEGLKMVVQLAEPMKSKILSKQSLGRTRAKNTTYLDIIDIGTPATKSWYVQRLPLFNKYATKCSEITFNDEKLKETVDRLLSVEIPKVVTMPFIHMEQTKNIVTHKWHINPFIHLD